jgi:hypothetical protein
MPRKNPTGKQHEDEARARISKADELLASAGRGASVDWSKALDAYEELMMAVQAALDAQASATTTAAKNRAKEIGRQAEEQRWYIRGLIERRLSSIWHRLFGG